MPIAYAYDEAQRLVVQVWVGEVIADQWRAWVSQRLNDPNMVAAERILADVTRWTPHESIGQEVLREVAQRWGASGIMVGKPVAIVAETRPSNAQAIDNVLAQFEGKVIVLNDLDTACTWLGVDPVTTGQRVRQMAADLRSLEGGWPTS